MSGFAHNLATDATTMSEVERVRAEISANEFFGCFAYATQSGFRAFDLAVGQGFWAKTPSRWLLGIDYGRTDPRALKEIAGRPNADVRIYDGEFVVDCPSFVPRRDYHPKVAMMKNTDSNKHGLVVGSGNFSYNGLRRSIESGASIVTGSKAEYNERIKPVRAVFEKLWSSASPLIDIITKYEENSVSLVNARDKIRSNGSKSQRKGFWIEAGYVTKNRGLNKPGNQIFAPNGFREFFGLKKVKSNTTQIGEIRFKTDIGPVVTKNYRENDNRMEKLTLPMPEDHGFGVYDGKVLVFEVKGNGMRLSALEPEAFELMYGHRLANVGRMTGGRRFGEFV